ncbi:MAG: hypothetical protein HWQ44_10275 [Nostoc sp. JL34]|nr:hypothetical protein [Nostoc sp. JL34]
MEWTRSQFQNWANQVAKSFDYTVEFQPIGMEDPEVDSPTQMAVFRR